MAGNRHVPWVLMVAFMFVVSVQSFAATVTAALDNESIVLGDTANLEIFVQDGSPQAFPEIPRIDGLQFDQAGATRKFEMINGQTRQGVSINYTITPSRKGDFTIPALSVNVDGRRILTRPVKLRVTGEDDIVKQLAFLKLVVPKTNVFVGEVIPVDIQLFVQSGREITLPQFAAEGFTVGQMKNLPQVQQQIGRTIYHVVPFKTTVTPMRVGELKLGPAQCSLVVQVPNSRRRRGDAFGFDLMDPFGDRGQWRKANLETELVTLQVNPLPKQNVPADFRGAIGTFTMTASVSPTNVAVGDPITIKTQISGHGAWDGVTGPVLDNWREFKVYPANTRMETNDAVGLEASKIFEQVVVPENSEVKEIPPVSFSYFDPDLRNYRTLSQPALGVIVRPVSGSANQTSAPMQQTTTSPAPPPSQQDIVHIKSRPGDLALIRPPLARQSWFLALNAVPFLAWIGAFIWRRRADYLATHPRAIRQKRAEQIVKTGLQELREQARAQDSEQFHSTVFRLLQEQIGERLDVPATAITEEIIDGELRPKKVREETLAELHELFQICNQARYAGSVSTEELESLIPRVEAALREIQKIS